MEIFFWGLWGMVALGFWGPLSSTSHICQDLTIKLRKPRKIQFLKLIII
jgi:hypothetical protein